MAVNAINNLTTLSPNLLSASSNVQDNTDNGDSFASYLSNALNQVNDLQLQSQQATNDLAVGNTDDIDSVMITAEICGLISLTFERSDRPSIPGILISMSAKS